MRLAFSLLLLLLCIAGSTDSNAPLRVVFLGDSLTAGYGVAAGEAFPKLIELRVHKLYPGRKIEVINAGSSGATTASALKRFNWQLKKLPTHLIIGLGANDGLRGIPVSESFANLESVISRAQTEKTKVLLLGMQMPPNYTKIYADKYKAIFPNIAKKYSLPLVPFLLKGVAGEPHLNLSDGIHPNSEGHKIIADHIWPYVKRFLNL